MATTTLKPKKRHTAGVLKYRQMGYRAPDYVPQETDVLCLFRITPQEGVNPDETAAIEYGLGKGYAWSVEYTDDPHPRNIESIVMSFIVNRPAKEPGFGLVRQEANSRLIRYTVHGYGADRPARERVS